MRCRGSCRRGSGRLEVSRSGGNRGVAPRRRAAGVVIAALVVLGAHGLEAQQGNWPGWRGDGNGVSLESDLPAEWHEIGYRWRTRIEGVGSSSPVVWDDQVFVTTSRERRVTRTADSVLRWFAVLAGTLVAGIWCLAAFGRRFGRGTDGFGKDAVWFRLLAGVDAAVVVSVAGWFFWSLRDLLLYRHETFTPEAPDAAWIVAGETAVFGVLAAVGSLGIGSRWRIAGCLALSGAGLVFYAAQPPTAGTLPVYLDRQLGVLVPLAAGVVWLAGATAVAWVTGRARRVAPWPALGWVRAALLAGAAASTFGYYNVVEPELGVMREVWALDRQTGDVQWRVGAAAPSGRKWAYNTYATPTPVTNGAVVVADFGPIMMAVGVDGEEVWTREEPLYMEYLRYGAVRSPVIHKDTVIRLYVPENPGVHGGITGERSYLAAFELDGGEEIWRAEAIPGGHDAYSSPLLLPAADGRATVIIVVNGHAHGFDADSGAQLWRFAAPLAHPVPSPVTDDRTLYVGGGLYGPQLGAAIDLGRFGRGERLPERKGQPPIELQARWSTNRQTPDIGSVLVYEGLVYWVTSDGRMFCYDAESGDLVWRERLPGIFEPSPVAGDGKIYLQATDGRMFVLAAGPVFEQLAVNTLHEFESSHASPAIAGGSLFLRGRDHLFAVGGRGARGAHQESAP